MKLKVVQLRTPTSEIGCGRRILCPETRVINEETGEPVVSVSSVEVHIDGRRTTATITIVDPTVEIRDRTPEEVAASVAAMP